jgi:integrase
MLARANVGLLQAQQLMGHSDPRLTAETYTHLGVKDLREAVERLQGAQ